MWTHASAINYRLIFYYVMLVTFEAQHSYALHGRSTRRLTKLGHRTNTYMVTAWALAAARTCIHHCRSMIPRITPRIMRDMFLGSLKSHRRQTAGANRSLLTLPMYSFMIVKCFSNHSYALLAS